MRQLGLRPSEWHSSQRCRRCRLHVSQLRCTALAHLSESGRGPSDPGVPHRLAEDLMADHMVRCPHGLHLAGQLRSAPSAVTAVHSRLVGFVRDCLLEAGLAPSSLSLEPSGLGLPGTGGRPADVGVYCLDYKLFIDVSVRAVLSSSAEPVAAVPGGVAREGEADKVRAIMSQGPDVRIRRSGVRYLPFIVEQFGRLGEHADALLRALAVRAENEGSEGQPDPLRSVGFMFVPGAPAEPPPGLSLGGVRECKPDIKLQNKSGRRMNQWRQRLSTWVHGTQAEYFVDSSMVDPAQAAGP